MSHSKTTSPVALCLLGAIACANNDVEPMTPAALAAPPPSNMTYQSAPAAEASTQTDAPTATDQKIADLGRSSTLIATARCEREVRCKNVGGEGRYATQDDCVVTLEPATRDELDARDCPDGIAEVELKECTEEISSTACDGSLKNIELISECSEEELCGD
jgi:hypothetical protein